MLNFVRWFLLIGSLQCTLAKGNFFEYWYNKSYSDVVKQGFPGLSVSHYRPCDDIDNRNAVELLKELNIPFLGDKYGDVKIRHIIYSKFLGSDETECELSPGYEIGALHNPAKIPNQCLKVMKYIDQVPREELLKLYPEHSAHSLKLTQVDIVDNANTLHTVPSESGGFLIGSHTIEHMQVPITAMRNWLRVLKKGGLLFMIAPNKCNSFDRHRLVTNWDHFVTEEESKSEQERMQYYEEHLREWTLSHLYNHKSNRTNTHPDNIPDAEEYAHAEAYFRVSGHTKQFMERGGMHFHTWNKVSYVEFLHRLSTVSEYRLPFKIEAIGFGHIDMIAVLRKL